MASLDTFGWKVSQEHFATLRCVGPPEDTEPLQGSRWHVFGWTKVVNFTYLSMATFTWAEIHWSVRLHVISVTVPVCREQLEATNTWYLVDAMLETPALIKLEPLTDMWISIAMSSFTAPLPSALSHCWTVCSLLKTNRQTLTTKKSLLHCSAFSYGRKLILCRCLWNYVWINVLFCPSLLNKMC